MATHYNAYTDSEESSEAFIWMVTLTNYSHILNSHLVEHNNEQRKKELANKLSLHLNGHTKGFTQRRKP